MTEQTTEQWEAAEWFPAAHEAVCVGLYEALGEKMAPAYFAMYARPVLARVLAALSEAGVLMVAALEESGDLPGPDDVVVKRDAVLNAYREGERVWEMHRPHMRPRWLNIFRAALASEDRPGGGS